MWTRGGARIFFEDCFGSLLVELTLECHPGWQLTNSTSAVSKSLILIMLLRKFKDDLFQHKLKSQSNMMPAKRAAIKFESFFKWYCWIPLNVH